MYDNNLDKIRDRNPFETAADILQLEHQFSNWKSTLPPWLLPIRFEGLPDQVSSEEVIAQYRIIVTLRFHTFRCLAHRPMLVRLLRSPSTCSESTQATKDLQHVGKRSLEDCVNSATEVIAYVHAICTAGRQQELLGTWWCSLFYSKLGSSPLTKQVEMLTIVTAFSAALNLLSIRFICNQMPIMQNSLPVSSTEIVLSFQKAMEVVESLGRGNRTMAKCSECLKHLYQSIPQPGKYTPRPFSLNVLLALEQML